ncbi:MAG: NADH:flavin oxidoreductase [Desulfomonilaceae bacterium]
MTKLFDNSAIRAIELKNRAIRSATWTGSADAKGFVTDLTLDIYSRLARGGIGLIITGYQYILPNGIQLPFMVGVYDDSQVPGLKKLADAVHAEGGKLVGQIVHTGFRANPRLFPQEGEIWAPSEVSDPTVKHPVKVMSKNDIVELIQAYADAARRLKEAGFDGVQLHAAHGYGINQFLARCWNTRRDSYGGSLANRYRFLAETMEAVRSAIDDNMALMIKLNAADFVENGLEIEETLQIATRLVDDGIDLIELSGGSASSGKLGPLRTKILHENDEAYFADMSARFKEKVKVPIALVGGFRSLKKIDEVLDDRKADYVSMSRPFIRQPDLVKRWQAGETSKATCISCNGCFETGLKGKGISCKIEREEKGN